MEVREYGDRSARIVLLQPVGDRIREAHVHLRERGIDCTLEWNAGITGGNCGICRKTF